VGGDEAALALIGAKQHHGVAASLALAGRILRAIWAEERNLADPHTLSAIIGEAGLDEAAIAARRADAAAEYEANTRQAIDHQVFGAPWYVWKGEPFWGQDRLDLLERSIAQG